MLTPSLVQPSHPLELNTIMVNKVDPEEAWQLWVSTLQSSRPTGHLGISFESELYLQPYRKLVKDIVDIIVISTWFADVIETVGLTIFALYSLSISICGTDSSESLITVSISLALVWDFLASIGVRVTEVSSLNGLEGITAVYSRVKLLHCSRSLTDIHRVGCRCRSSPGYSSLHRTGHSQRYPGTPHPRDNLSSAQI